MTETMLDRREPLLVGANHRTSSMTLRDRLFLEDTDVPGFLESLRARGLFQAMVLSTCDRIEVLALGRPGDDTAARIVEALAARAQHPAAELTGQLYVLSGAEAVAQVYRVAASLDSLIVGEPQVLGQVKAAHRLARTCGMIGGELETLLQSAYGVAKRVRTETGIGERPVSIAAAALARARDLHGEFDECHALVIGAGDMGMMVASALRGAGLKRLILTHPHESRVESAARELNCHIAAFDALPDLLADADIVIAAMGRRRHTLSAAMIDAAVAKRRHKPVLLVDTGIPGDIEPAVSRIDDAFVYDLNDLERLALAGRAEREAEAEKAAARIETAVAAFMAARAERTAVPAIGLLRRHFEEQRLQALSDAGGDAEKATRLLVNRLLHAPSEALRNAGSVQTSAAWKMLEGTIRKLFALDPSDRERADREESEK